VVWLVECDRCRCVVAAGAGCWRSELAECKHRRQEESCSASGKPSLRHTLSTRASSTGGNRGDGHAAQGGQPWTGTGDRGNNRHDVRRGGRVGAIERETTIVSADRRHLGGRRRRRGRREWEHGRRKGRLRGSTRKRRRRRRKRSRYCRVRLDRRRDGQKNSSLVTWRLTDHGGSGNTRSSGRGRKLGLSHPSFGVVVPT